LRAQAAWARFYLPARQHAVSLWGEHPSRLAGNWRKAMSEASKQQPKTKPKFSEMRPAQKAMFIVKLTISILSFGMIFPNIMSD
jgi:hypothetical protein